ncbi:M14 family metallopeptidase [candidate division KSB1 bacterium]
MKKPIRFGVLFISALVICGLFSSFADSQVTPPEEFLGFIPGADFYLATYEQAIGYYELIASQTDRMQIFDMGPTSFGRRMKYGVVSSEENMARLDRYKEINEALSLVRDIDDEEARSLADEGKVIVWIDGGLHATEVAPAQLMPQLAYDLVTGEDRKTRSIRENVIALLVFANPDGMTLVSDWYMNNVGTQYEISRTPFLYHKYAGHDNNRDSFMGNLIETRNINRAHNHEWYPEVLYNQHQTGPFPARIFIPPESEPMNPNVHSMVIRWKNMIGTAMGKAFEEENQPGAISRLSYDSWYPGYVTQVVEGHNIVPILTETQLYRYATPHFYTVSDFPEAHRDLVKGSFYPSPWEGGWWRLGDAVAYNRTACFAVLDVAARYKYDFLYNKYIMGRDVVNKFANEPPYGWIFSLDQQDGNTTSLLMNRLINNGIEIYRAESDFTHEGISYSSGSYLVPTSQPFGYFAKNLLEKQNYPDLRDYAHLWQGIISMVRWDGAPLRSYDGVGWTLPLQMGITSHQMSSPLEIEKTRITEAPPPAGEISGRGSQYLFSHTDNNSFIALDLLLKAGGSVSWARDAFTLGGASYPAGTFIVQGNSVSRENLESAAANTHIMIRGGSVNVNSEQLRKPRIALYKSWVASMDMGWITYIFDDFGYDYHLLTDAEVRAGNLRNRFDVILLPDQSADQIINGHQKGTIHPNYVGGITTDGVENIKSFVKSGGVLLCNNSSSSLPVEHFNLPIKNVLDGVETSDFNSPGSILKMEYDIEHPLAFGLQEEDIAFFSRGQVFEMVEDTTKDESGSEMKNELMTEPPVTVARYPGESTLLSGWIIGEEKITGKSAVLDVTYGEGRIILYGFNIHNRAQSRTTFKLLFNGLYYR